MQTQPLDDDDALIAQVLGTRFLGRRYLRYAELEALGLCDNRASLRLWMDAGAFPRGIKIPGPYGKTLVWSAVEIARLIALRMRERNSEQGVIAYDPENEPPRGQRGGPRAIA
jgi:hypothetical protein